MELKKGQILELEIADIAFGGRGLAKVNGLAVFVDQVAPLDRARVRIVRKRKNYAEARLIEILSPSPYRIEPPCPYSGMCGGCKWQFLDYERQIEYKQQHVVQSLAHIGGIDDVRVHAVLPSRRTFGYRNKMEFTCSDRRWLMPAEMGREGVDTGFALGLHVPGTFYKVLDTRACLLQPDLGNTILGDVRDFMKRSGHAAYGLRSHIGFWRFLMLRYSVAYDQWMANIITAGENQNLVRQLADRLTQSHPQIVSVMNNITARKAGIAVGEYEICLSGAPAIRDKIGPFEFEISANSFFQTNTTGAEQLYSQVKKYAGLTGSQRVVDLYSGTGTIAIWLASEAKEVVGIEIVESAVKDALQNCRRNGISNCRFVQGDIIDCLPGISSKPDVLIIDPPRAGMHKKVVKLVLEMMPAKIVYVSCNPATMARDVAMMKDAYRILEVQPVDMFPHTYHIESVARLERIS
jgi:23S rRNA (uracil1939-C5)-methyltransferase